MTPEQEEQVRRALAAVRESQPGPEAGAGHGGEDSMPPEVAARLDGVLADLVRQRSDDATAAAPADPPDELARRRRSRWQRAGLAAAAACVAGLVGTAVANGGLGAGGASSTSSSDDAARAERGTSGTLERAPAPRDPEAASGTAAPRQDRVPPLARLRTSTLAADVQRLVDAGSVPATDSRASRPPCDLPALRRGERLLVVRLDGRLASLVLGPPDAGRRPARVVACRDAATTLATAVVRTRSR
jgi:hypothetical protein